MPTPLRMQNLLHSQRGIFYLHSEKVRAIHNDITNCLQKDHNLFMNLERKRNVCGAIWKQQLSIININKQPQTAWKFYFGGN